MIDRLHLNSLSRYWTERTYALRWMKWAIVLGVLMVSALLARRASMEIVSLLAFAVVGVASLVILLRYPQLGIIGLLVASMLLPLTVGGGPQTGINATILLTGVLTALWLADMFVNKRRFTFVSSRTNLPLIAFIVVCFLAFIGGQIQWFMFAHTAPLLAQLAGLGLFVLSLAAFLVTANQIKDILWLKRLTWVFLALGGFYLFARLLPQQGWTPRALFQYGSDASMFWIWVVTLSASQALFNRTLALRWRIILGGLCASAFYVSFAQAYDWKSGWLPALVGLFVVVWLGFPRFRLPLILAGLAVAALELLLPETAVLGGEDYSLLTRMEAYRILLEIVKVNPILGFGPANYYYYTPLFPILGYSVSFNSHNNYIDIVAQVGLLGLLCFLWFFWELAMTGWRLLPKVPEGFEKAFVIGVLGGIAGTLFTGMLGDWIIPFVYNVGLVGFRSSIYGWVFMGGLVALEEILRRSSASVA